MLSKPTLDVSRDLMSAVGFSFGFEMPKLKAEPTRKSSLARLQKARDDVFSRVILLMKADHKDLAAVDAMIDDLAKACSRAKSLKDLHAASWDSNGNPIQQEVNPNAQCISA